MEQARSAIRRQLEQWWQSLGEEQIRQLYWFFALLGTLPALRANGLLPHDLFDRFADQSLHALLENPIGLFALLPMVATWLLARRLGGGRYLLAVWPYLLLMLATSPAGQNMPLIASLYAICALTTLVLFVFSSQVMSAGFGAYVVFLLLWRLQDTVLTPGAVLLFVLSVLVTRLAIEAVRQNLPLARDLGRSNVNNLVARTLTLWWPMLILLAIGIWLSKELNQRSENTLYELGLVIPWCSIDGAEEETIIVCPPGHSSLLAEQFSRLPPHEMATYDSCLYADPLPFAQASDWHAPSFRCPVTDDEQTSWPVSRLPLFDNIDRTVARVYAIQRTELRRQLASVDASVEGSRAMGEQEARRLFSVVPRTTGMSRRHCDFPYIACEAGNLVITELNKAYKKGRARTEARFVDDMGDRAEEAGVTVQDWTKTAGDSLDAILNSYEANTRGAIARVHSAINVLRQILLLWLVVMTIKSLLYVLARVIFDKSTTIDVDLLERDGVPVEGKVRQVGEVDIPADYPHDIYYKANYQPLGPAPRFSIPQWRASLLSRLRHGAWNMSLVTMPLEPGSRLTFNSIEAEHLVDWEMCEGEEIVFSYRNFVAMNAHVQLRTVISLRIASLLMGRIVFHTARCQGGSGRLILRTRGKPATAQQVQQSIPAARLVAWNRYARFSVDSHLTRTDVFLNGFNLRRSAAEEDDKPQGILIVEADARDGGMLVGTLRFAKNFLMPV